MKKLQALIVLILLLVTFTIESYAQKVITLKEAISLAQDNNTDLANAKLDLLIAQTQVSQAYSENLLPTLKLTSSYTRTFLKPVINIFGENIEFGSDNSISNKITLAEPIPVLGTPVFQGIRIAEYYEKLNEENLNSVNSSVIQQVTAAYYNVLFSKEVLEVNMEAMQNASDNYNVVEAQYNGGIATEFDFLRAKVNMENIAPSIDAAETNLKVSKLNLQQLIGMDGTQSIDVVGNLTYDSTEVYGSTDSLINNIVMNNVAVRQLQISNKINQELISVQEKSYLPELAVFGLYELTSSENDNTRIGDYQFFNSLSGGISLSWDLNLFRNSYEVQIKEIQARQTLETLQDTKRKLRTQAVSVILNMDDAKQRIITQKENVKLAERSLQLANYSFIDGVATQIDVLNSELTLSQTKLNYLQAIYDYLIAKSQLEELLAK